MRISNIKISGFRSIQRCAEVKFNDPDRGAPAVEDVTWDEDAFCFELRTDSSGQQITGVIGPNSAGKSNILRALLHFFSTLDADQSTAKPSVELDFHCYDPANKW